MNKELMKRLEKLEHLLIVESFTVVYKDGHREKVKPGECVLLVKGEQVKAIEGEISKENGQLVELLNGMLEESEGA